MASSIWDLEELVINILRWLPPAALLAARVVCKPWNTIVLSHRSYISKPCCYLHTYAEGGRLFDPVLWAWVRVSVPTPSAPGVRLRVVPSDGNPGLVAIEELYGYELERPPCFWVGNPMTSAWKFVPGAALISADSMERPRFQFVVVGEGPPARYKIVAFGESPTAGTGYFTVVYDSAAGEWSLGARFPGDLMPTVSAHRDGRVVFVSHEWYSYYRDSAIQVFSYDLEENEFEILVDAIEGAENIETHGAVFLKGQPLPVVVSFYPSGSGRVRFHEFQENEGIWRLVESSVLPGLKAIDDMVATIPQDDIPRYFYPGSVQTGDAEHLYLNVESNRLALYVAGKDEVTPLPLAFPAREPGDGRMWVAHMCTFYPRFDMRP